MSVIGRLDDQVEAVLINPLKRPPATDEAEREQPATRASISEAREREDSAPEKREAESPLPVWLL